MRILAKLYWAISVLACVMLSCKNDSNNASVSSNLDWGTLPDTLKVGTLYSPTSYFIYRDEKMGYDYDLISQFAADHHMVLDLVVAPNMSSLEEMLDSGTIDVAAYEIPITKEYRDRVIPAGIEEITNQVLVQPKNSKDKITDITQLIGRDIYVEKGSKYYHRLKNLDNELGGGINIHTVEKDTLITEDLLEMTANGKISLTVVDSDIAQLNRTYYNTLDIGLEISFPQRAAWGVSPKMPWLADSIDTWFEESKPQEMQANLLKRYFELSKGLPDVDYKFPEGKISQYDELFKKYASNIDKDWDWRVLAAQGFAESRFNPNAVSWAGARGLMQIMPKIARSYGSSPKGVTDPETGIKTATKILKDLNNWLKKYVPDDKERRKFVIAAYNCGYGHVTDAIALAKKQGLNPQVWDNNVEKAMLMKSKREYYSDPVVKYGYARGLETTGYVKKVMDFYEVARKQAS